MILENRTLGDLARPAVLPAALFLIGYVLAYSFYRTPSIDTDFFTISADGRNYSQNYVDLLAHGNFTDPSCAAAIPYESVRERVIERVFKGKSPWENFPPPHVAPLLDHEMIRGWGSNDAVFEHLIEQVRPKTIIEVGSFLGGSAIHMAKLVKKFGLQTQIVCVDDFRGWPGWYEEESSIKQINGDKLLLYQFMQNVAAANAVDTIVFVPFGTSTALVSLCQWGVSGDLVEIDAGHDFHSAWNDINNGYKLLRPGGVLFGHDYSWDTVKNAVHLFARIHGFGVRIDGAHWILY